MKSNRALSIATVILGKLQGSIITADASTNAGKLLALLVIAGSATKTVRIAEQNLRSILERRSKYRLVVVGCLAGDGESNTRVTGEDDVAGALFGLLRGAATEGEDKAAGVVLGPGGDVELGQGALITGSDFSLLASGNSPVGVLLRDDLQESRSTLR